jgi:hypothetical protein
MEHAVRPRVLGLWPPRAGRPQAAASHGFAAAGAGVRVGASSRATPLGSLGDGERVTGGVVRVVRRGGRAGAALWRATPRREFGRPGGVMRGVVLAGGATGSMETSMRQGGKDRPAARALGVWRV